MAAVRQPTTAVSAKRHTATHLCGCRQSCLGASLSLFLLLCCFQQLWPGGLPRCKRPQQCHTNLIVPANRHKTHVAPHRTTAMNLIPVDLLYHQACPCNCCITCWKFSSSTCTLSTERMLIRPVMRSVTHRSSARSASSSAQYLLSKSRHTTSTGLSPRFRSTKLASAGFCPGSFGRMAPQFTTPGLNSTRGV